LISKLNKEKEEASIQLNSKLEEINQQNQLISNLKQEIIQIHYEKKSITQVKKK